MAEKEFLNVRFKKEVHLANKQRSRRFCFGAKVITAQTETAIKEEANWIGLICVRVCVQLDKERGSEPTWRRSPSSPVKWRQRGREKSG